jgi:hypothetical protein
MAALAEPTATSATPSTITCRALTTMPPADDVDDRARPEDVLHVGESLF